MRAETHKAHPPTLTHSQSENTQKNVLMPREQPENKLKLELHSKPSEGGTPMGGVEEV